MGQSVSELFQYLLLSPALLNVLERLISCRCLGVVAHALLLDSNERVGVIEGTGIAHHAGCAVHKVHGIVLIERFHEVWGWCHEVDVTAAQTILTFVGTFVGVVAGFWLTEASFLHVWPWVTSEGRSSAFWIRLHVILQLVELCLKFPVSDC